MSAITPDRRALREEELQYPTAVSESGFQKFGAAVNFVNFAHFLVIPWALNGPYGDVASPPVTGLGGLFGIEQDLEIINVYVSNRIGGSSGQTEIDVLYTATSGGSFTSIFSTTPVIDSTASDDVYFFCYDRAFEADTPPDYETFSTPTAPTGCTLGVLTATPLALNKGSSLRFDLLDAMPGAEELKLIIFYRPR